MSPKSRSKFHLRTNIGHKHPKLGRRQPEQKVNDRTSLPRAEEQDLLRSVQLLQGTLRKDKCPWPYR